MNKRSMTVLTLCVSVTLVLVLLLLYLGLPGGKPPDLVLQLPSPGTTQTGAGIQRPQLTMPPAVELDAENIRRVLSELKRPESYYCRAELTLYWDGGYNSEVIDIFTLDSYTKLTQYDENGEPFKHTVIGEGRTFLWYEGGGRFYTGASGEFTVESEAGLPSYDYLDELPVTAYLAVEYRPEEGGVYLLTDEGDGYVREYKVSLDTGIPVSYAAYQDGQCVYQMKISNASAEPPLMEIFRLPNGNLAPNE